MPKPIFLIGVSNDIRNEEQVQNIRKAIQRKIKDYHVLVYTSKTSGFYFKCFYEKDFDNVRFEELKEIVKQTINK
jgi:hypothetical protein